MRDQIVAAAASLFARRGYGATSTAAIARAARVSEGTLFHHFRTKRALLAEVGHREGARVLAVAFDGSDPDGGVPDLDRVIGRLFDYAQAHPDTYRLFALDGDLEDLEAGFAAKQSRVVTGLAAALGAWGARGHLRPLDPELVAPLVFALVDTAVRHLVLGDAWSRREAWRAEVTRAVRTLLFDDTPGASGAEARKETP